MATCFGPLLSHHQANQICISLLTYLLTYLRTPWSSVLLEKLTGLHLFKKFSAFYWTRRFITAFTIARQLPLSWASPIQSIPPHPTSWRSILIFFHLRLGLPRDLFPSDFPTKPYTHLSPSLSAQHAPSITFFSILLPAQYWASSTDHEAKYIKVYVHGIQISLNALLQPCIKAVDKYSRNVHVLLECLWSTYLPLLYMAVIKHYPLTY
jgi:hypothetical protein